MNTDQADEILDQIENLATQIELDEELAEADGRYKITAKWIDTDITNVSL